MTRSSRDRKKKRKKKEKQENKLRSNLEDCESRLDSLHIYVDLIPRMFS